MIENTPSVFSRFNVNRDALSEISSRVKWVGVLVEGIGVVCIVLDGVVLCGTVGTNVKNLILWVQIGKPMTTE